MIGDVGGTNVRFALKRISVGDRSKTKTLKQITKLDSQTLSNIEEGIKKFLADVQEADKPHLGVCGFAGPVVDNMVEATNIKHWPICRGQAIADACKMKEFIFINDFEAAGYGVLNLTESQFINLNDVRPNGNVKAVIGPGTGLGECLIHRSHGSNYYDVIPCEGGHCDFAVRNQEDWDLVNFARDFIENSDNIENERAKGKIERVSCERLIAGPAVPLIFKFME